MSGYTESQDWLNLKHRTTTKPCVYGLSDIVRESDWDFADTPSRGYSFASESTPIQLLNNSGGMDEDDDIKDVWYPHQAVVRETEDVDSEMNSADDMDMDMSVETTTTTITNSNLVDTHQFHQQSQHHVETQHHRHHRSDSIVNKRKRDSDGVELNAGLPNFGFQQPPMAFDSSKRLRVGA